jgi:LPS-assembly lipoprotein
MSLSNRIPRRCFTSAVLAVTAVALAGCVRPLYGTSETRDAIRAELTAIDVAPINDVSGYTLRQELLFNFTGGVDSPAAPRYKLEIKLNDSTISAVVDPTGRATAGSVRVDAAYVLRDMNGHRLAEGSAFANAAIDRLSQRFATVRAVREGKIRVAKALADEIETRLATYFASR